MDGHKTPEANQPPHSSEPHLPTPPHTLLLLLHNPPAHHPSPPPNHPAHASPLPFTHLTLTSPHSPSCPKPQSHLALHPPHEPPNPPPSLRLKPFVFGVSHDPCGWHAFPAGSICDSSAASNALCAIRWIISTIWPVPAFLLTSLEVCVRAHRAARCGNWRSNSRTTIPPRRSARLVLKSCWGRWNSFGVEEGGVYRRTVAPECDDGWTGDGAGGGAGGLRRELVEVMTCESEGLGGEGRSRMSLRVF
jgi:hypothetical protein